MILLEQNVQYLQYMIKIDYPENAFRIKNGNGRELIFDEIRKTWLALTPEEWVRQNFVNYLQKSRQCPAALIALEKQILVGEMVKRFDILIYDIHHQPWMMVECKSMDVPLNDAVLHQLLMYHLKVPVTYLVITNGTSCMCFKKENLQLVALEAIPVYGN